MCSCYLWKLWCSSYEHEACLTLQNLFLSYARPSCKMLNVEKPREAKRFPIFTRFPTILEPPQSTTVKLYFLHCESFQSSVQWLTKTSALAAWRNKGTGLQRAITTVYKIPLSCGLQYIGQAGRCFNERAKLHNLNVHNKTGGFFAKHCKQCCCSPYFQSMQFVKKGKNQVECKYVEAFVSSSIKQALLPVWRRDWFKGFI